MLALSRFCPLFEMSGEFGYGLPVPTSDFDLISFDYDGLPLDVANEARAAAEQIRTHDKSIVASALAIGRTLLRMQDQLGHGDYLPWVKIHAGLSTSSAYRYTSIAKMVGDATADGKLPTVGDLTLRTLADLAASHLPKAERNAILADLSGDDPPDNASVRKRIEAAKSLSPAPKPKRKLIQPEPTRDPELASPDPVEASPDPVGIETAKDAPQEPASADPAASPVIQPEQEPEPPETAVVAVEMPAAEPAVGVQQQPAQVSFEDVDPLLFRFAERLREAGECEYVVALAALIGDDAIGRGLCRVLRDEPAEVGQTTRPFPA